MNIPGLGVVTKEERFGWYYSETVNFSILDGAAGKIVLEGYDEDRQPLEFHTAISNLLNSQFSVLKAAEQHIFSYYQNMNSNWHTSDEEYVHIESPNEVWRHIQLGNELMVTRRAYGDKAIYVSIECNCDWEQEHGLQIVLRNGTQVVKVGPYDGHLTNSDAYADGSLENVVYKSI